ncbi:MAG: hypothetical protein AAGI23_12565 [Bacteroidota bacterium]
MIQRDYFERLTQQVAKVLARLIGKDWEKILLAIEQAFDQHLPITRKELLGVKLEGFEDWIGQQDLSDDQLEAIAMLLQKEGEHIATIEQQKDRFARALLLYEVVESRTEMYSPDRVARIRQLNDLMDEL